VQCESRRARLSCKNKVRAIHHNICNVRHRRQLGHAGTAG
jgi:hypothetical protein